MSDSWDDPDNSEFFVIKDHVGDLLIIAVNEYIPQFPTTNGVRDTVKAEIAVVEGNGADLRFPDALLFGSKLVPQLRNKVGTTVLGRLNLGEKQAGKNAPYILDRPTAEDKALASKWVSANGSVTAQKTVTANTLTSVSAGYDDDDFPA